MTEDGPTAGLDPARLPRHIAIIMDGNGRWARKRFLPRIAGHRAGVKAVDRVVTYCRKIGVEALTLYSFSSENWKRPADEVGALMNILKEYLERELERMLREDIRFNAIGTLDTLPAFAREAVLGAMERTRDNKGMVFTLALSYGSRDEMVRAARNMARAVKEGRLEPESINEDTFSTYLDTAGLPDPDLLIRTSGELRLSNFLLWQTAYTELFFTDKLWPDIGDDDVAEAIAAFGKRERRFGKTTEQVTGGKGQVP
ncbi:MAG: isoprenyl transferase [Nitrospinae bacterium]|nr:isoprenyl transferase [Nitrospinota bacterium]